MKTTFRSLLILVSLIGGALTSAAQQPRFGAPKDYVLVLGDSLAFGYQLPRFLLTQDPANHHGLRGRFYGTCEEYVSRT
jgi:hypothetical protein